MSLARNVRKSSILWFLVFSWVLVLLPLPIVGDDSDFEIRPYVQNMEKTSATILWKPAGKEAGKVEYGPTTAYGASADGTVKSIKNNGPVSETGSIIQGRLSDLVPGTVYHYRVIGSSYASEDRTFQTPPPRRDASFTFVVYGDSRSDPAVHNRVIAATVSTCHPAFVLATGDMVPSSAGGQSVWMEQFFGPADPLLRESWFFLTRGNHEDTSRFYSLYFEGAGGSQEKGYYSFDWGPVHVVTLDTNVKYEPGSEQYEFLKHDLAGTDRPLKVFFGHHPAYSSGAHGPTATMQQYLQPLFEKNGVALVLSGHDHHYERTIVNGITYIVSGGGGAPLYGQEQLTWKPGDSVCKKAHHFVQVDVTSGTMFLTIWAVDAMGATTVIDRTVIKSLASQ